MAPKKTKSKSREASSLSQQEILTRLSDMAGEFDELRSASVKYLSLKKILARLVEEFPPHTRMPGIRALSLCIGTSLVTTQRAVNELLNENVLYSRPRSGVFVSDHAPGETTVSAASSPIAPANDHPFRAVFDFATDSAAPHQRKYWEELASMFSRHYPNVTPALHFASDVYSRDKPYDAWERYDWRRPHYEDIDEVLDIADFAGTSPGATPGGGGVLPLYHRTYFTFYNQSLLEKHRLPAPDYHTFAGQTEYLRNLAPKLNQLGFDPRPFCTQEPVTLIGRQITEFCQAVVNGTISAQTKMELVAVIEKLNAHCRLLRYSLKDRNDWMQARLEFVRGQSPLFLGYSVDYWELSQKKLPFDLKAYPTLCCDDTYFLWPRIGQISRHSQHPMESMNFLYFLLREEVQKRFAETGNFGANLSQDFRPKMTAAPDWTTDVLCRSVPFHFRNSEGYYLAINVLGGELWRSLTEEVPAIETLDRALQMGRSYLKHRPAAMSKKSAGEKVANS